MCHILDSSVTPDIHQHTYIHPMRLSLVMLLLLALAVMAVLSTQAIADEPAEASGESASASNSVPEGTAPRAFRKGSKEFDEMLGKMRSSKFGEAARNIKKAQKKRGDVTAERDEL